MENQYERTINLIGEQKFKSLSGKKVIVLGIGGVGGFVVEALARAGVQNFVLVDNDVVNVSNINRQIIAKHSTIGQPKVEVMKNRLLDINPNIKVETKNVFLTQENVKTFDFECDYVIDCIDNITAKIAVAVESKNKKFNLISCMGTGNKLSPELFEIDDIFKTSVCPLAKVMRKKLRELNVDKLTVLYSKEEPLKTNSRVPASISFCPSIAGLRIAEYVIKQFIGE